MENELFDGQSVDGENVETPKKRGRKPSKLAKKRDLSNFVQTSLCVSREWWETTRAAAADMNLTAAAYIKYAIVQYQGMIKGDNAMIEALKKIDGLQEAVEAFSASLSTTQESVNKFNNTVFSVKDSVANFSDRLDQRMTALELSLNNALGNFNAVINDMKESFRAQTTQLNAIMLLLTNTLSAKKD